MKINLAKSAGFCFGVKRAIEIALQTARSNKPQPCAEGQAKNVYLLGDIVHNEDVVEQIRRTGIKKIKKLTSGKNKTLLIRAHGADLDTFRQAERLKYKIIDATCPMVKEIHKIARENEGRGYKIVVIGDKKHDEVLGIVGQLKTKAIVIDEPQNIPWLEIKKIEKACVVVQSTQNIDNAQRIVDILRPIFKELKFSNTICRPTQLKQEEIRTMPKENDLMIIIGSKKSANTRRLYEISKSLNKYSYWVESKRGIKPAWFKEAKSVGVTAGASTPDSTTQEVIAYLKQIT